MTRFTMRLTERDANDTKEEEMKRMRPVTETMARICDECDGLGFVPRHSTGTKVTLVEAHTAQKCDECDGFGLVARKRDESTLTETILRLKTLYETN